MTASKIETCPGGRHKRHCGLSFSSTRVGDAHLVEMDTDGWSRHLTRDEMLAITDKHGRLKYRVTVNAQGVEVIGRADGLGRGRRFAEAA